MRLPLLLLFLLSLAHCEEQENQQDEEPMTCVAGAGKQIARELYAALNCACADIKDALLSCCSARMKCLSVNDFRSEVLREARGSVPRTIYTNCGLEQAKCIDRAHASGAAGAGDDCRVHTDAVKAFGLRQGRIGDQFAIVPELGVGKEVYGNCSGATATIDECARNLKECIESRANRPKPREGEMDREPYGCSNAGKMCLEPVLDINRTYQCAQSIGYAMEFMGKQWKAKVDGYNEKKASPGSVNPFASIVEDMEKHWGFSEWEAFGIIFAASFGCALVCCCLCYCCAISGLRRQKEQRRWAREQKKRGADRYSNTESARPSSVRVSRYSQEDN